MSATVSSSPAISHPRPPWHQCTALHLHLVPGKHTNSLAKPKTTESASVRNIRGPPPLPLPDDSQAHRVRGSVTVSVLINIPSSGLSETGDSGDWERFLGQVVHSRSNGLVPRPPHTYTSHPLVLKQHGKYQASPLSKFMWLQHHPLAESWQGSSVEQDRNETSLWAASGDYPSTVCRTTMELNLVSLLHSVNHGMDMPTHRYHICVH